MLRGRGSLNGRFATTRPVQCATRVGCLGATVRARAHVERGLNRAESCRSQDHDRAAGCDPYRALRPLDCDDGAWSQRRPLVLATFCAKTVVTLRALGIASNFAFVAYGSTARLWPIVPLHAVMLPLNATRLREVLSPSAVPVKSSSNRSASAFERSRLTHGE
jgi:hypothetical protein